MLAFSCWLMSNSATPGTAACQAFLSFTISQSLLKFMSIESGILYNHFILCHPLLLLPSIFPSIRVFSKELVLRIRWPKYWSLGEGNSTPLQYSCLENPMDGGAWWATVHSVTKSRTQLSDLTFTFTSAAVLPINIWGWFPLGLIGLISWYPRDS